MEVGNLHVEHSVIPEPTSDAANLCHRGLKMFQNMEKAYGIKPAFFEVLVFDQACMNILTELGRLGTAIGTGLHSRGNKMMLFQYSQKLPCGATDIQHGIARLKIRGDVLVAA
jgi:hypothetical protein